MTSVINGFIIIIFAVALLLLAGCLDHLRLKADVEYDTEAQDSTEESLQEIEETLDTDLAASDDEVI